MKKLVLLLCISSLLGCEKPQKEFLNVVYVLLDESSHSYSFDSDTEVENAIPMSTDYLRKLLTDLYYDKNRNEDLISTQFYFSYVDENTNGNMENYLELPIRAKIEEKYKSDSPVSKEKAHKEKVNREKANLQQQDEDFEINLEEVLRGIEVMLVKSKNAKGSDCSRSLLRADKKLNSFRLEDAVDATIVALNRKIIIAFSDLVNFPKNVETVQISNNIIRPGYSAKVPYIQGAEIRSVPSDEEFKKYFKQLLTTK